MPNSFAKQFQGISARASVENQFPVILQKIVIRHSAASGCPNDRQSVGSLEIRFDDLVVPSVAERKKNKRKTEKHRTHVSDPLSSIAIPLIIPAARYIPQTQTSQLDALDA